MPWASRGHLIRGRLATAKGDAAGARGNRACHRHRGQDWDALGARCQILFEHGHPSEAEAALRALIDCQPEDASAYHNLGILMLWASKRHDEAAPSFRQALRHRADFPATYLHLGFALKESGRLEEAISAWEQVLRLSPNDVAAHEELKQAGYLANGMRRALRSRLIVGSVVNGGSQ